ncbi:MAG: hypothetical protein GY906_29760 [bacterium]|nr:hypothetical protein [bacterium]
MRRGPSSKGQRSCNRVCGIAVAILTVASAAVAQVDDSAIVENFSFAHLADLGFGSSGIGGAESTVGYIPISFTLRSVEEHPIGIRLRLPLYFGVTDVPITDIEGQDIAASIKTLSVVPGLEFLIPVGERGLVKPYGEVGAIQLLDTSDSIWLVSGGVKAAWEWPVKRFDLGVGGKLQHTSSYSSGWLQLDKINYLDVGGMAELPLWFNVGDVPAEAGVFVIVRRYFDKLRLSTPFEVATLDGHTEVGLSFAVAERPKLLGLKLPPWYGVGYRFTEGYRAVRVYLGFPF